MQPEWPCRVLPALPSPPHAHPRRQVQQASPHLPEARVISPQPGRAQYTHLRGTGPSHRDSSQQTQGSPPAPTSKSVHSLVPLPRTCFDTFLLIIQVSTHNASEITVLVSLSAYSGTWVYSFLKDTFTKCFLGMAVPEQSNNPNHCHCHFQTSHPQSLLPQHSLLSKMIYWLAHFLTFHPKKSIFTLLSTPLQELKARLGISKPCYLNVCIKYKWHARVKHLLCINPSDATYTPNLIDSTPFGNFKSPSPYF